MNIAFVNATKKWGGVKTWTLDVARELSLLGHGCRVYGRQPEFIDKAQEQGLPASLINFGPDYNPLAIGRFLWEYKRHNIDRVVVNIGRGLKTAGVAARMLSIPVVQRVGLPRDIGLKANTRAAHSWINPVFLVPCQWLKDGFVQSLPYVTDKDVKVILNSKFPATDTDFSCSSPRVLMTTSQLNPEKGHDDLLKALAGIDKDFKLMIVGTGTAEDRLKALCSELGLDDKVQWFGFTKDVAGALDKADLFLLPSKSEGLPNALLEAMARGLAPISRDVGGVREIWPEELGDYLLPVDARVEDLRRVLGRALELDDEALADMKGAALKACETKFHLKKKAGELERWLLSLEG